MSTKKKGGQGVKAREINKKLATEVMGWVFDFQFANCERYLMKDGNFVFTGDDELVIGRLFNPAGDIKDAFEVVGEMWEKGYKLALYSSISIAEDPDWFAQFETPMYHKGGQAFADTPEMAISLAALAVKK